MKGWWNNGDGVTMSDTLAAALTGALVWGLVRLIGLAGTGALGEADLRLGTDVLVPLTGILVAAVCIQKGLKLPLRLKKAKENGGNGDGNGGGAAAE